MNTDNKNTLHWMGLTFVLFPVLLLLGIYMRTIQANLFPSVQDWFYPMMTLHGVGMAGVWWMGALACASQALSRYTHPSERISRFAFYGSILGVLLLLASVLGGRFAAGWYFLYPLPFQGTWPSWATICFLLSLTVLGAVWLIWTVDLLMAIARKYTLSHALGWHYIRNQSGPDVPPVVLISTISLIAGVACLFSGVITLVFYFYEVFSGIHNDALLMKNLTFLFGHLLVNLSLYLGVGLIYETLPHYTSRPWPANKIVAIAWNCVLVIVLFAYFHHLYMDFVQPTTFQYIGQIASYMSSLPSAVVTVFGGVILVYKAPVKWNLGVTLLFFGMMGWGIGGIGAVIDSTIALNSKFHNTLWVPAHFHSYMIEGLVFMVLGYFYHYCQERVKLSENLKLHKIIMGFLIIGGYGFLLMFYLAGAKSIPRRFATYPSELSHGAILSGVSIVFATLFLLGLILYLYEIGKRWTRAYAQ